MENKITAKVYCKEKCGFEDVFEPDEIGINYYQAIGECPNCGSQTVYEDGDGTKVLVIFTMLDKH